MWVLATGMKSPGHSFREYPGDPEGYLSVRSDLG